MAYMAYIIPECLARVHVSLWGSGGWGCVRSRSQPSATVRARSLWPCLWQVLQQGSLLEVSHVAQPRFAWQGWHLVTFRRVSYVSKVVFSWQAQYFCDVFRRWVPVSWQAQQRDRSHCQGCLKVVTNVQIPWAAVAFYEMCWKLTEASHETSIFR